MNKKMLIAGILIVILFLIIFFINKKDKNINNAAVEENKTNQAVVKYDEETQLYYIRDEKTNEIIAASKYKDDLNFYVEHPNYTVDPFQNRSTDLKDFLYENEERNME